MRRWIILTGRSGTVLLAIGLALLLVSFIPPIQTQNFSGSLGVLAESFEVSGMELVLTPQLGLSLAVSANGTLNVYLLEVNAQQALTKWINEHQPQTSSFYDITNLEAFLEAEPNTVGWQTSINNERTEHEYIPTKITNASIVISNPSSGFVTVSLEGSITGFVGPASKVRTLATWIIPTGLVLALPWLADSLRTKTKRPRSSSV
jgi:hypothetical protein